MLLLQRAFNSALCSKSLERGNSLRAGALTPILKDFGSVTCFTSHFKHIFLGLWSYSLKIASLAPLHLSIGTKPSIHNIAQASGYLLPADPWPLNPVQSQSQGISPVLTPVIWQAFSKMGHSWFELYHKLLNINGAREWNLGQRSAPITDLHTEDHSTYLSDRAYLVHEIHQLQL